MEDELQWRSLFHEVDGSDLVNCIEFPLLNKKTQVKHEAGTSVPTLFCIVVGGVCIICGEKITQQSSDHPGMLVWVCLLSHPC